MLSINKIIIKIPRLLMLLILLSLVCLILILKYSNKSSKKQIYKYDDKYILYDSMNDWNKKNKKPISIFSLSKNLDQSSYLESMSVTNGNIEIKISSNKQLEEFAGKDGIIIQN